MEKESVKISKDVMKRLRKYAKSTNQSISGYLDMRITESLDKDEKELKSKGTITVPKWIKDHNKQF